METRKIIAIVSCIVLLVAGIFTMVWSYINVPITYDGSDTSATELYDNPASYDLSNPDGVADIIVKTDLDQTKAANVVAAIVFDYRGFDTIGESFILLAAISGAHVILHSKKKEKKEADK